MPSKPTSKGGFYAVHKGKQPGVFLTWDECCNQTKGYPGAKFKKFANAGEAEYFVANGTNPEAALGPVASSDIAGDNKGKKRALSLDVEDELGWDVVYSDGACKGNGKAGSVAGVGVWWGHDDPRNIAERCPGDQTNNRAELIAIARVLESTPRSKKPLLIKTDSQYSINCFQNWISNWSRNGWVSSSNEPVKNSGVIRYISALLDLRAKSGQKVRLQYVKGHSGDVGNDGADAQANRGTTQPPRGEPDWAAMESELRRQIKLDWNTKKVLDADSLEVIGPDGDTTASQLLPRSRRRTQSPRPVNVPSPQKKELMPRLYEKEVALKSPVQPHPLPSHALQVKQTQQNHPPETPQKKLMPRLFEIENALKSPVKSHPLPSHAQQVKQTHQDHPPRAPQKKQVTPRLFEIENALKSPVKSQPLPSHVPQAKQTQQDDTARLPLQTPQKKQAIPRLFGIEGALKSPVSSHALPSHAPQVKQTQQDDTASFPPQTPQKKQAIPRLLEIEGALKSPVQSHLLPSHASQVKQTHQGYTARSPPPMAPWGASSVVSPPVPVNKEDLDLDIYADCILDDDDLANDLSD